MLQNVMPYGSVSGRVHSNSKTISLFVIVHENIFDGQTSDYSRNSQRNSRRLLPICKWRKWRKQKKAGAHFQLTTVWIDPFRSTKKTFYGRNGQFYCWQLPQFSHALIVFEKQTANVSDKAAFDSLHSPINRQQSAFAALKIPPRQKSKPACFAAPPVSLFQINRKSSINELDFSLNWCNGMKTELSDRAITFCLTSFTAPVRDKFWRSRDILANLEQVWLRKNCGHYSYIWWTCYMWFVFCHACLYYTSLFFSHFFLPTSTYVFPECNSWTLHTHSPSYVYVHRIEQDQWIARHLMLQSFKMNAQHQSMTGQYPERTFHCLGQYLLIREHQFQTWKNALKVRFCWWWIRIWEFALPVT